MAPIIPFQYLYLALACIETAAALVVFAKRADLRLPIVIAGICGGTLEVVSEVWYTHDYWHPLSIIPGWPAPEDFLYGFGVTALTISVVPFVADCDYQRIPRREDPRLPRVRAGKLIPLCISAGAGLRALHEL